MPFRSSASEPGVRRCNRVREMPDFWLGDAGVRDPAVNHFGWTRLKIRLIIQRFQVHLETTKNASSNFNSLAVVFK
jgi:hypothetical protein